MITVKFCATSLLPAVSRLSKATCRQNGIESKKPSYNRTAAFYTFTSLHIMADKGLLPIVPADSGSSTRMREMFSAGMDDFSSRP